MLDTVIRNSTLFGLEGDESRKTDIGLKEGLIAKIGRIEEETENEIDGEGYYTLPGFVDVHSHSDYYLLIDPSAEGKVLQGISTEVGGNCGYSCAPIGGEILDMRRDVFKEQFGLDLDWRDFNEYFSRLGKKDSSVNFVGLIGYNTLRASVLGLQDVPVENDTAKKMIGTIKENLQQGAAGMSVGLVYPPACFATKEEMAEMVAEVQKAGKIFTTHIRSEGNNLLDSIEEVIDIARRTGVKLQISHLKTAGKENWHKIDRLFEMLENAREEGVDIECDRYPYIASNTGLQVVLPDWAFDGGRDALIEKLRDKSTRKKFTEEIIKNHPEPEYWESVMVSQVATEKNYDVQGVTVAKGAELKNCSPFDFIYDLLIEEKTEVEAIYFCMNENNMDRVIGKDYVMIGSDSGAKGITGPLSRGRPHPRTFGTFPRFFGDYVFGRKLVSVKDAVRKTSTAACERFGIKKRGRLMEGYHADIVMIDPKKIRDTTSYENPLSYPEGVDYLWVNGLLTVSEGKHTGALAGRGLEVR